MRHLTLFAILIFCSTSADAQFGGRPGDAVLYLVTAKGSADFQTVLPGTANDSSTVAAFRVTSLDSVPVLTSEPFHFLRQMLHEASDEVFIKFSEPEGAVGPHRIFVTPAKFLILHGMSLLVKDAIGPPTSFLTIPKDLDLEGEISLERFGFLFWAPKNWPPIVPTDRRGPIGPPEMNGFEYAASSGLAKLANFIRWVSMRKIYPGSGWPNGVDLKLLEADAAAGSTIRLLRLRPGTKTPLFRVPGHTHLYVLQGQTELAPANSSPVTLKANDYAFLPGNFVVKLSNPKPYDGPDAQ
ncbi:MAG: hypothetical protein HY313_08005 [Acidobacteria bacterium]|nr:hypothetical protein [Acidobacteriota bacterium]